MEVELLVRGVEEADRVCERGEREEGGVAYAGSCGWVRGGDARGIGLSGIVRGGAGVADPCASC